MLRAKEGIVPPGGWHFIQATEFGKVKLEGSDKLNLIDNVTAFRIQNNLPLGTPEDDIDNAICGAYPHFCGAQSVAPPVAQPFDQPRNFRERVAGWLANRYQYAGTITLESEETAESRAKICQACPKNTNWREGCPPCVANADRLSLMIRQARTTDTKVLGCSIAGQDNATAVHLPEKHLRHRNRFKDQLAEEAPHCWLLKLDATV